MEPKPNIIATESELNSKLERIYKLLTQFNVDALLLRQSSNFAWATCGAASYINTADSLGNASLLITPTNRYVLTDNIEDSRLMQEEALGNQGWEFKVSSWYEQKDKLSELTSGLKLGADTGFPDALDLSREIMQVRSQLTPDEGIRFKTLGMLCADGMSAAVNAVRPGMTEFEIAAMLSQAIESKGVQVIVNLIATDERIFSYRHPLPTSKRLQKYAMLVLCGRKWGLVCSLTRLIHFGAVPHEISRKAEAVARIDAEMIAATRPNNTLGDVFRKAQESYVSAGYPDEWQLHHQGGSAGYMPREFLATPRSTQPILDGQVFAWNPSITGVKSEDTILIKEHGNEVLTAIQGWPMLEVHLNGQTFLRPAILER
jgi:Xaa-Pro aminopeptidase